MVRVVRKVAKWTGKETVTVDQAVAFLNDLLEKDSEGITKLLKQEARVNEKVAEDPSVQVSSVVEGYVLRPLGLLNGMFGVDADEFGPICSCWDLKTGRLTGFIRSDKRKE